MNNSKEQILEKITILREKANYSQDGIAEKMNITQSKYARFESGKTKTDLDTLRKFCEVLNMELVDFFLYPDKKEKEQTKAIIQIELKNTQKETILKQLLGKEDLEILN